MTFSEDNNGVAETLRSIAAELREHPERWLQGTLCRDAAGEIPARERDAVCWCAAGFLHREFDDDGLRTVAWDAVEAVLGLSNAALAAWNDAPRRTAAEVADAFDRAAALAESQTEKKA